MGKSSKRGDQNFNEQQLRLLLGQCLESISGMTRVYQAALRCNPGAELELEWQCGLDCARNQRVVLEELLDTLGLDRASESMQRRASRGLVEAHVDAIALARAEADRDTARVFAAHVIERMRLLNRGYWQLLDEVGQRCRGRLPRLIARTVAEAHEWSHHFVATCQCRALWLRTLHATGSAASQAFSRSKRRNVSHAGLRSPSYVTSPR